MQSANPSKQDIAVHQKQYEKDKAKAAQQKKKEEAKKKPEAPIKKAAPNFKPTDWRFDQINVPVFFLRFLSFLSLLFLIS